MKKIITSALVVMATTLGFSQEVKYGVKGGLNMSYLWIKEHSEDTYNESGESKVVSGITDIRNSFFIGGLVEVPISERFSGQVELLYASNGGNFSIQQQRELDAPVSNIRLQQLILPVFAKYQLIESVEGLKIGLGGYISYTISAAAKSFEKSTKWIEAPKDILPPINAGIVTDAEYSFQNGLFVDIRSNIGLTNVFSDKTSTTKNWFTQIGVGYKF